MSSAADAGQGMLCPVCKVTLSISERQGVEIDFCPQCRGVWLDRGELDKIIERSETAMPQPPRDESREGSQPWGHQDDRHRSGHHGYKRRRGFLSDRSEEHTSELQSLMRISYAVFCLKKKKTNKRNTDQSVKRQHKDIINTHEH